MNRTVIFLLGGVFVLLMAGLVFTLFGDFSPYTPQVSNPEASTGTLTDNQGIFLALLVLGVPGIIVGMGASLYFLLWLLNRQVTIVQQQPEQPFELLPAGADAETVQFSFANNAFFIIMGVGALMVLSTLVLLALFA